MSLPEIVSRHEWLIARKSLLAEEKQLKRRADAVNVARRQLPMVRIDKEYRFEGPEGPATLLDLFAGRRQLVVYHFMFGPDWETGCPGCTATVGDVSPEIVTHLATRGTTFALVSRAPFERLETYKAARGWIFDWYSSSESDFNYDFHATLDPAVTPLLFNYKTAEELHGTPQEYATLPENHPFENSGLSAFLRDGDEVFHTYSTFGRGTEQIGGTYNFLDLTTLGRQEDWEEPRGRVDNPGRPDPSFGGVWDRLG
jgi:predicted dithiol-disulfide oxidoreductase (DUF899 family)